MGTLTLERCASMRAEMEAGRLRDEVLSRAGISADEWTVAQREWLDKMGAELKKSRFELTNRYTQAFLERQREIAAMDDALVVEASPDEPLTPRPPAALPPMAMPPMALQPPVAPPLPVAPGAAPDTLAATPSPWAAAPSPSPWAGEETGMPAQSPLRGPLPFQAGGAPPPAAAPPAAVPLPPPSNPEMSGTMIGAISPFAVGAALPFAREGARDSAPASAPSPGPTAAPPKPAPPLPPRTASTPGMPAVTKPSDKLMGTVVGAVSPFAPSLPFAPARPPPAPPPPAQTPAAQAPPAKAPPVPAQQQPPPVAAPATPQAPPPAEASGITRAAPASAQPAAQPSAQAAPGTSQVGLPGGLTLEQYVSLCAEIAHDPSRTDETLARYRITAQTKADLDGYWKARAASDPAIAAKWREAYQMYAAFLAGARRR